MGAIRVTIDLENTVDADIAQQGLRGPETVRPESPLVPMLSVK